MGDFGLCSKLNVVIRLPVSYPLVWSLTHNPNKGGIPLYTSIFNPFLHTHVLIPRHICISQKLMANQQEICIDMSTETW